MRGGTGELSASKVKQEFSKMNSSLFVYAMVSQNRYIYIYNFRRRYTPKSEYYKF